MKKTLYQPHPSRQAIGETWSSSGEGYCHPELLGAVSVSPQQPKKKTLFMGMLSKFL